MQRAKAFLYVSLGILALAISFHLGAQRAEGQSPSLIAAAVPFDSDVLIITENGDLYLYGSQPSGYPCAFAGNIFSCLPPTGTEATTWGRVKAERR